MRIVYSTYIRTSMRQCDRNNVPLYREYWPQGAWLRSTYRSSCVASEDRRLGSEDGSCEAIFELLGSYRPSADDLTQSSTAGASKPLHLAHDLSKKHDLIASTWATPVAALVPSISGGRPSCHTKRFAPA